MFSSLKYTDPEGEELTVRVTEVMRTFEKIPAELQSKITLFALDWTEIGGQVVPKVTIEFKQ